MDPVPRVMPRITVYSPVGLCHASVCVEKDTPVAEIESYVNTAHPTGISSPWEVSKEKFADGTDNPHACELIPTRLHYLMVC